MTYWQVIIILVGYTQRFEIWSGLENITVHCSEERYVSFLETFLFQLYICISYLFL